MGKYLKSLFSKKSNICMKSRHKLRTYLPISFLRIMIGIMLLSSCKSSLSPYFSENSYVDGIYEYVVNDSLKFVHKTFGDVVFEANKKQIIQSVPKNIRPLDNILAYGVTDHTPNYQYYILLDSKKKWKKKPINTYIKDSIMDGHKLTLIFPGKDSISESDLKFVAENTNLGKNFREKLIPLEETLSECFQYSNNYLSCLDKIDSYPVNSDGEKFFKLQMQLTFSSFLGNNSRYKKLVKKAENSNLDNAKAEMISKKNSNDSLWQQEIVKAARNKKLIMFNENHFYPNHRTVLRKVLPELYDMGYKYLALEALEYDENDEINLREKLKIEDGFYTREPQFIELIRTAKSLGITLISYDDLAKDGNREINQADNIYEKIFEKNPNAKAILLAGVSHIFEKEDRNGKTWMAKYFKEKYDIDPLTISQTTFNNYHKLVEEVGFFESSSFGTEYSGLVDYILINNLKPCSGQVTFDYKNSHDFPVQLSIFPEEEIQSKLSYMKVLPYYNYYLGKGETCTIHIDNEKYVYYVLNSGGKVLENEQIEN